MLKAGGNKGADSVMLLVAILFALFTALSKKSMIYRFLQIGLLSSLFYYSACLVFGVTFNRLFPVYVLLFSANVFGFLILLNDIIKEVRISNALKEKKFIGTAIYLIISGLSVLVWLEFIIPAVISGEPLATIEIYTTEPTFVFDLGIVLPTFMITAYLLLKKHHLGFVLTPILLTFMTVIGVIVIAQNIYQTALGIEIPIAQMISLVISFMLLGILALLLNIKFLNNFKIK